MKGFILFFIFVSVQICFAGDWIKLKEGIPEDDLYSLCIHPSDKRIIYCGGTKAIYRSQDRGRTWQSVYTVRKKTDKVNFMFYDSFSGALYVGLGRDLLRSKDEGETFQRVFCKSPEKVLYIAKNKSDLYVATDRGLYISAEGIWQWQKIFDSKEEMTKQIVFVSEEIIFIITESEVYRSKDNLKTLERVFTTNGKRLTETEEDSVEEEIERNILTAIYIDKDDPIRIYLGTNKGVFISSDCGDTFTKLVLSYFGEPEIRWIEKDVQDSSFIFLATNKGFFRVDLGQKIASNLYQGLITQNVRFFQQDGLGRIWLVTDRSLHVNKDIFPESTLVLDTSHFQSEPTIREFQEAVLRYNEVHPEKIKTWRKVLKYKALFPTVKLDYDKTISWEKGDKVHYIGPYDWGLTLSWNIADLIWNPYQDDIDNRSRLNTQLRISILEDVNRIYFERERLKRLLEITPPKDEKEKIEKQLRLEELTALLDGYTGGIFSKREHFDK